MSNIAGELVNCKHCKECGMIKLDKLFNKKRGSVDGLQTYCRQCQKKINTNYRNNNRKFINERHLIHRENNRDKITARSVEYKRKKRKTCVKYKLSDNLRSRFKRAFKNNAKTGSAVEDLGCSIDMLKVYLESLFKPGMSWNNYGLKGWHIDHIIPLAHFDLTDIEEVKKACHYTNLQPLWAKDNLKKNKRIINE